MTPSAAPAARRRAPSDLYAAYPGDRDLMESLGLRVDGFAREGYDHLGTVEFDNGYAVSVEVTCAPAQFWRFTVARHDGSTRVIDCNSRGFAYHWRGKIPRAVRGGVAVPGRMVTAAQEAIDGSGHGRVVPLEGVRAWAAPGPRGATHIVMRWERHWFCSCGAAGERPCDPMKDAREHDEASIDAALARYEGPTC